MFHSISRPVTSTFVPTSRRAAPHRGERLRQDLVQRVRRDRADLPLYTTTAVEPGELVVQPLALVGFGGRALLVAKGGRLGLELAGPTGEQGAELRRLAADLVVAGLLKTRLLFVDRVDDGLDSLAVPLVAGPHECR